MFRLALRGIGVRRMRAAFTALAVLLGMSMVSGTLVFTDTVHRAIHDTFAASARGSQAVVSGREPQNAAPGQAPAIPAALLARIRQLSIVEHAEGQVSASAAIVHAGGTLARGSHLRAMSFLGPPFAQLRLTTGRGPRAIHEVAIDEETARREHARVGAHIGIATDLPLQRFRVVGLVRFGGALRAGIGVAAFSLPAAQNLFLKEDRLDTISVAARPGHSQAELARAIAPLLPHELLVRTTSAQVAFESGRLQASLAFLEQILLALGLVAVLVGAFVIFNTFLITTAQRTRELGLLRALGASRRRIFTLVLGEALLIGLLGSAAAVAAGYGAAQGARAVFDLLGQRLPEAPPVLSLRTVLVSLGGGLAVTAAAALAPALRATRVAPLIAIQQPPQATGRVRVAFAAALLCGGAAAAATALSGPPSVLASALGGGLLLTGVALLAPRLASFGARAVGLPIELATALAGRLGRENAMRSAGRTAASAAALAVGLGLVVFVAIFAAETRSSIRIAVAHSFAGDLAITPASGDAPIPAAAAGAMLGVPGVQTVSALKRSDSRVAGAGSVPVNGFDTQTLNAVYHFDWVAGDDSVLGFLGPNGALVERALARRADLHEGSHFSVTAPSGKQTLLTVRGIYRDPYLLSGYAVALPTFGDVFHQPRLRRILVKFAPGTNLAAAQRAVTGALLPFPEARARSERDLANQEATRLDNATLLLYALLAVSVIVSLLGLANTLALQIHERTREIGLLRALGASRRTVRRIVRYESVICALLGGAAGIGLGMLAAALLTAALDARDLHFAVPRNTLVLVGLFAPALGVLAAVGPARRAARTDLLDAIAYE
ncbi:MAG: ABC transporter permease [Solirubrobacteraceae bacterium]